MRQKSVLIVKPDISRLTTAIDFVRQVIADTGVAICREYQHHFTREDVFDTWPKWSLPPFAVSAFWLCEYMTSGPSIVLVVEGEQIVERCRAIRQAVRERWGKAFYANAMHTPTEPEEIFPTLVKFDRLVPIPLSCEEPGSQPLVDGLFGRLEEVDREVLLKGARAAFQAIPALEDEAMIMVRADRLFELRYRKGQPNASDYGVSAIAEVFPQVSVFDTLAAYLRAEKFGWSTLLTGSFDYLQPVAGELARYQLTSAIVPARNSILKQRASPVV